MADRVPVLIAVTDLTRLSMPLEDWASALFAGGVDLIQLREPAFTEHDVRNAAQRLVNVAPSQNRIQVNTHVSIAQELACGIHLPERAGNKRPPLSPASRSIHSAEAARASDAFDFVVAGHIYQTNSKPGLEPRGVTWLEEVIRASSVPVIAIGGICAANAAEVIRAGAAGVAVIGALSGAADPGEAAFRLRTVIDNAWKERQMQDQTTEIEITLNGKPAAVLQGSTILDLVAAKELTERLVVVELNGTIVPRSAFGETRFAAGDQVEIVHFVGGGSPIER